MALSEFDPAFNPSGSGGSSPGYLLDRGWVGYTGPDPEKPTATGVGGAFGASGPVSALAGAFGSIAGIFTPGAASDFPVYSGSGTGGYSPSAMPTETDIPALATGQNMLDRIGAVLSSMGSGGDAGPPQATNADWRTGQANTSPVVYAVLGLGALAAVWMIAKG